MKFHSIKSFIFGACICLPTISFATDSLLNVGKKRTQEGASAQSRIDGIDESRKSLSAQYSTQTKIVDGLKIYNDLLAKQITQQQMELDDFEQSLQTIVLIDRQIVPLMQTMIDSLDQFVQLDIPFLQDERRNRIEKLKTMMVQADITSAEKFRKIMEAYEIENDYGRTIEAYKGTLNTEGVESQVEFLRIGRVTLMYQSIGGGVTAAWDKQSNNWQTLPPETYKRQMAFALKVARKQAAPELLVLPVPAAQGAGL